MKVAQRIASLSFSATIEISEKVTELENQGHKVIQLAGGQSCLTTPDNIKFAAVDALNNNQIYYSHSRGIPLLRNKILKRYFDKYNVDFDSNKNILITPGVKQALLYFMLAFINPGDEVLIPVPSWMSYAEIVKIAGGIPVLIESNGNKHFEINIDSIKSALTSKTRAIILNSPNNPTGQIISKDKLIELHDLCIKNNLFLLSDEIYDEIVFDDSENCSIAQVSPDLKNCVLFNGFSKAYSMTGWRLGYVIAQDFIIDSMLKLQQNSATCPNTFAQFGALEAFDSEVEFFKQALTLYKQNRAFLISELNNLDVFDFIQPKGSFYMFINVSKVCNDSKMFCLDLLEKCKVAAMPGVVFGNNAEGYIRINLAVETQMIVEFVDRIKTVYVIKSFGDNFNLKQKLI